MNKYTFATSILLAFSAGFTACSQDYLEKPVEKKKVLDNSTYMSVSFVLPVSSATPVSPATRAEEARRYQYGIWNGSDKFKKVEVYVFDRQTNILDAYHKYNESQLRVVQKTSGTVSVTANEAFKVKKGPKRVYITVNWPETKMLTFANQEGKTTLTDFLGRYAGRMGVDTKNIIQAPTDKMLGDYLASTEDGRDVITMTGQPDSLINIEDGVSRAEAVSGSKNQAKLTVERVVARILVTTAAPSFEIKGDDPRTPDVIEKDVVLATLSELTYTVAQGEKNFYPLKRIHNTPGQTQDSEGEQYYEESPAFKGATRYKDDFWPSIGGYHNVSNTIEYTGLWRNESTYEHIKQGFEVKTRNPFLNSADKEKEEINNVVSHITSNAGDRGLFICPTTHTYGNTPETSGYYKTNTPYILIRGLLTPKIYVDENGKFKSDEGLKGKDFYIGDDGIIYATKEQAVDDTHHGYRGQYARKYVKGKTLYFLWPHPDNLDHPLNSPIDRNNIYHVQIKGAITFGANWNPLVPYPQLNDKIYDYSTGKDKRTGKIISNPNNPDDRPNDNEIEPPPPPVNPYENITPKKTWMATEVTVVPWAVHSYPGILR